MTTEATEPLTEAQIEAIATRKPLYEFGLVVGLTPVERDALIRDWRVLQAENDGLRGKAAELRNRISEHGSRLAARISENAALREKLVQAEIELRRRRNGDELPQGWTVLDVGDGFPNLYLYSRADIVTQAKARLDNLQSRLADAEKRGRLEGLREADQVSHTVGAIRERIKLLESQL